MSDAPVLLKSLRSHFLGGREVAASGLPVLRKQVVGNGAARAIDMNGSYCAGQLYVQEYRLAEPRHPHPVLMWHGGGMTGAQWESTPDGRQGWLWRLLQSGYDVFVADAPERGRASWAMYPQIYDAAVLEEGPQRAPAGTQTLQLTGGSLYRVNTLRINGKRVPLRYVETVSYGECLVCVDAGTFNPGGTYRISVGKRCTLPPLELFRSNTVTFTVK